MEGGRVSRHGRGQHKSPSKTRDAVSLVFSFFLSLALLSELLCVIAYASVFSKKGFISVFDGEYYQYVLDEITKQATYFTAPTGIDASVLNDVFKLEEVRKDVGRCVSEAYDGNAYEPHSKQAEERLARNVTASLSGSRVEPGENQEKIVDAYVEDIMEIYRSNIKLPGLDALARVRNKSIQYLIITMGVIASFGVVLAVSILKSHHYVHRGMRYTAYAFGGAALMSILAPAAMRISGFYKGIGLTPRYFYHFGVSFVERVLFLCMIGGIAFLILTLVLIVIINNKRKAIMSKNSRVPLWT